MLSVLVLVPNQHQSLWDGVSLPLALMLDGTMQSINAHLKAALYRTIEWQHEAWASITSRVERISASFAM